MWIVRLALRRPYTFVVLALLIVGLIAQQGQILGPAFAAVGLACLVFNLVSMLSGYFVPRAIALPDRQATAIAMEIGIHNGTLAIFVALSVLQSSAMSLPAAVYSLIMYVTASAFAYALSRRATRS